MDVYVRISARSGEEAFASARAVGGGAGFALDADVVTGVGPALVGALDELGPVLVVAGRDAAGTAIASMTNLITNEAQHSVPSAPYSSYRLSPV